jgi:hypothetical protein
VSLRRRRANLTAPGRRCRRTSAQHPSVRRSSASPDRRVPPGTWTAAMAHVWAARRGDQRTLRRRRSLVRWASDARPGPASGRQPRRLSARPPPGERVASWRRSLGREASDRRAGYLGAPSPHTADCHAAEASGAMGWDALRFGRRPGSDRASASSTPPGERPPGLQTPRIAADVQGPEQPTLSRWPPPGRLDPEPPRTRRPRASSRTRKSRAAQRTERGSTSAALSPGIGPQASRVHSGGRHFRAHRHRARVRPTPQWSVSRVRRSLHRNRSTSSRNTDF